MLSEETPLSFTYLVNTDSGNEATAAAIQQDLSYVGIDMEIQTQDWNVFLNERKVGNYDICRQGWVADYDDPINMLEMWISDSGNNDAQLGRSIESQATQSAGPAPSYAPQNWDEYDALIDQIKAETDLTKRVALMHQAEDMLMDTWAIVPLYYYNDIYMQKSNVEGVLHQPVRLQVLHVRHQDRLILIRMSFQRPRAQRGGAFACRKRPPCQRGAGCGVSRRLGDCLKIAAPLPPLPSNSSQPQSNPSVTACGRATSL